MAGKTIERHGVGKWMFELRLVPCGKANCGRCPHGPYWYAFRWSGGRVWRQYVGKNLRLARLRRQDTFGAAIEELIAIVEGGSCHASPTASVS